MRSCVSTFVEAHVTIHSHMVHSKFIHLVDSPLLIAGYHAHY